MMYELITLSHPVMLDDGVEYDVVACTAGMSAVYPEDAPTVLALPNLLIKLDYVVAAQYTQYVPTGVPIL